MAQARRRRSHHELIGLLLIGLGILLLLALLSFDPKDVPSWLFYAKYSSATSISSNFIGRFGAIIAGLIFFLLGGASFFAAVALLGLGIAAFGGYDRSLGIRLGWATIFVFSWAFFFDFLEQTRWMHNSWKTGLAIPSAGGWFGHALGIAIGKNALGNIGSIIIFALLALISISLATGLHPISTLRHLLTLLSKAIIGFSRLLKKLLLASFKLTQHQKDPNKQEISETTIQKERELAETNSRSKKSKREDLLTSKKSQKTPTSSEEENSRLAKKLPPPKIIDASVPLPAKPTLEEVLKKHQKKRGTANSNPSSNNLGSLSTPELSNYQLPPLHLLEPHERERQPTDPAILQAVQKNLLKTLAEFGIDAQPGDITKGPTITRYEVYPAHGVRVDRIANLEKDLARATCAERINILAPIPGKDTVGIEIANSNKSKVTIREIFESAPWQQTSAKLPLALGKDVYGKPIIADLAKMPHLLVAGATGSGKSVCINSLITSLVFQHTPETLRFIMIDPKVVEMQLYNDLPHLVTPVVTDPKKVLLALRWVIEEMEKRYKIFAKVGVRNISSFNDRPLKKTAQKTADKEASNSSAENLETKSAPDVESDTPSPEDLPEALQEPPAPAYARPRKEEEIPIPDKMPFIVVIIDELADLMQTTASDVESAIARITQMARAAGIHLIVATQTPRADVVTGIIKANIPTRIAFQVASKIDSRVILDENGAERLLGQGDMLYLPPGSAKLNRAQGVLVTDEEIGRLIDFLSEQSQPTFEPSIAEKLASNKMEEEDVTDEEEELIEKCLEIIRQERKASTSMLQRRLRLGYTRAARVVDILEQRGILGPKDGARDREILIDLDTPDI